MSNDFFFYAPWRRGLRVLFICSAESSEGDAFVFGIINICARYR